jgi:IPT/TIG domain
MQTYELPIVSAITPDASTVGCKISVTGANLQYTSATVGGVKADVEYKSPTWVIVTVPADAISGPVQLTNDTGNALNAPKFLVTVERHDPPVEGHREHEEHHQEHHEGDQWNKPWNKKKK